jgi:hypothetical protein
MKFKEWIEKKNLLEFQKPQISPKWKISKEEIIKMWQGINPDIPIAMRPISKNHTGSTYGEDGIRITGSPQFINSILGKIRPLLNYETTTTKLVVSYRETQSPSQVERGNLKKSYVFYVQSKERG